MNCEPGDLAFVIKSQTPSNVGLIVRVIGPHSPLDTGIIIAADSWQLWHCEAQGAPLTWSCAHGIGSEQRRNGPIPDECLRPIRGGGDDQFVDDIANIPHGGVVYAQQTECA